MANATTSRLGLVNNTGTDFDALFLKIFSGEVLTAFARNNIFNEQLHSVRTITSGKSAQFPVLGTATAALIDRAVCWQQHNLNKVNCWNSSNNKGQSAAKPTYKLEGSTTRSREETQ